MSYQQERQVAIAAVLKASLVARDVQKRLVSDEKVDKPDKSPVTVGDYTSQALVASLIAQHFPTDQIVGEEDSSELNTDKNAKVKAQVVELANKALNESLPAEEEQSWKSVKEALGGKDQSAEFWMEQIDRGNSQGGANGRHWALDPIDGTKGFLRKEQYAVCLGLLQDGEVVLGVMGCPNLPVDPANPSGPAGLIFVATRGGGAFVRNLDGPDTQLRSISMRDLSPSSLAEASFCESVESGHSDQSTNAKIASLLGITKPSVRMDSQAKYCSISRGDGDIYLRLPVSATYEEKIWDHCAGAILVAEAGGVVSDMNGKPLDFAAGRTLKNNKGVVACHKNVHAEVIKAVEGAVKESANKALA